MSVPSRTMTAIMLISAALAGPISGSLAASDALAAGPRAPVEAFNATTHLSAAQATRVLQRALGLPADGIFGPRTQAAVRAAQRRHRLAVDGVAGPATWHALGLPFLRTLRAAVPRRSSPPSAALTPSTATAPSVSTSVVGLAPGTPATSYVNPFAGEAVTPERIDMGVDYGAVSGTPIHALGSATILVAKSQDSGWPGGGLVIYRLTSGSYAGDCVYVAEDLVPLVRAGQAVSAGANIAVFKAGPYGIETGWTLADGQPVASALQQDAKGLAGANPDPGRYSTGAGVHFATLLAALGAPLGLISPGGIQGAVAAPS